MVNIDKKSTTNEEFCGSTIIYIKYINYKKKIVYNII